MTMINKNDANVLSYVRVAGGDAAVVAINLSGQAQTVTLDAASAGVKGSAVKTLAATDASMMSGASLKSVTLPPFGVWVGEVK